MFFNRKMQKYALLFARIENIDYLCTHKNNIAEWSSW